MTTAAPRSGEGIRHSCASADQSVLHRQFPLACPRCRRPIQLQLGLNGFRMIDAILLQAERLGAEIECRDCGLSFILHRSASHAEHLAVQEARGLAGI